MRSGPDAGSGGCDPASASRRLARSSQFLSGGFPLVVLNLGRGKESSVSLFVFTKSKEEPSKLSKAIFASN